MREKKIEIRKIIEELYKIKTGIEADNFTRENIDALIKRLSV